MSLFRRVGLLLAAALISSLLVALPGGPAHADYDLGVTWPETNVINPEVSTYSISVVDSGPGDLFAVWQGHYQPIPHNGLVDLEFHTDGQNRVEIWRCVGESCEWAGVSSPMLELHRFLDLSVSDVVTSSPSPGTWSAHVQVAALPSLSQVFYAWTIDTVQWGTVASGTADLGQSGDLVVDIPAGLSDGMYYLRVTAHGDYAGGAVTSNQVFLAGYVDNTPPEVFTTLSLRRFYPVYDRYRDFLDVTVETDGSVVTDVDVIGADGTFIGPLEPTDGSPTSYRQFHWNGRLNGKLLPPGNYQIRASSQDDAGNRSTDLSEPFALDHAKRKLVTSRTVLPAAKVVYDRYVGRCSSLVSPSSHRWPKSLGYYSQTKCKSEKKNASVVALWHAWWLPEGMKGVKSYRLIKVEQYGGPAVGQGSSYMVMGYIDTDGDFFERVQFNRGLGWHAGHSLKSRFTPWVQDVDGRPFFIWSNGLTAGSRYDIKAFRLTVTVEVLAEPDGTIVSPRGRRAAIADAPSSAIARGVRPTSEAIAR